APAWRAGGAAPPPPLLFAFVALVDWPVAVVFLVAGCVTLVAPAAWHRLDRRRSRARQQAYGAFAAELLDAIQGLATLKAFGQSTDRAGRLAREGRELFHRTMGVLGTNTLARGLTDTGMAVGAAAALALGAYPLRAGRLPGPGGGHDAPGAARRPDARRRGVPPAPRAAGAPPPGHARPRLRRGHREGAGGRAGRPRARLPRAGRRPGAGADPCLRGRH